MLGTGEKLLDIRDKRVGRVLVEDGAVGTLLADLDKDDAPKYGVEVTQGLIVEAKPLGGGAYLMPPISIADCFESCASGVEKIRFETCAPSFR